MRARECHPKRESSLVVSITDISWMVLRLPTLTMQGQHTKNQVPELRMLKCLCVPCCVQEQLFRQSLLRRFLKFSRKRAA